MTSIYGPEYDARVKLYDETAQIFYRELERKIKERGPRSSHSIAQELWTEKLKMTESGFYDNILRPHTLMPEPTVSGSVTARQQKILSRLNHVIQGLGIHNQDLEKNLQAVYPDFNFGFPQSTDEGLEERLGMGCDPLLFFQRKAKELGNPFDVAKKRIPDRGNSNGFNFNVSSYFFYTELETLQSSIGIHLYYDDGSGKDKKMPDFFRDYVLGNGYSLTMNKPFREFNPLQHSLDYFNEWRNNIEVIFSLQPGKKYNPRYASDNSWISLILRNQNKQMLVSQVRYRTDMGKRQSMTHWPEFADVKEATRKTKDFRPYLHRILEMYAEVPKHKFHDPVEVYGDEHAKRLRRVMEKTIVPAEPKDTTLKSDYRTVDPLEFIRGVAKDLGEKLEFEEIERCSSDESARHAGGNHFFHADSTKGEAENFPHHVLWIWFEKFSYRKENDFLKYLDNKNRIEGKTFSEFSLDSSSLTDFGKFLPDMNFRFCYINNKPFVGPGSDDLGIDIFWNDGFSKKGEVIWQGEGNGDKELYHYGFDTINKKVDPRDFRPYLHRMLELYFEIPRRDWHNPAIYSDNGNNSQQLEKIVDSTIDLLFTGKEKDLLTAEIEKARLNMRKGWASIPRLSLGAIALPTPGQRNISHDEFVVNGSTYLVEYLSQLGIMESDRAEEMAAQKLVNYFIHRSGFQISQERAREIVQKLNDKELAVQVA